MNYKNEYQFNRAFREYVDKYCKTYGVSVEEALKHELVKEVGRYYTEV